MYTPVPFPNAAQETLFGIPFRILRDGQPADALSRDAKVDAPGHAPYRFVSLAGMVNRSGWCSEWWGQNEPFGCYNQRLFIGDRLGILEVWHTDYTQEMVELIFGLNVWNYDLFCTYKPYEHFCYNFGGGFDEPFRSDPEAAALLHRALCLNVNPEGDKGTHFVLCVQLNGKPVEALHFRPDDAKRDDPFISGVTFSDELPEGVRVLDPRCFLNRSYQDDLADLAHRLYTYTDDIPQELPRAEVPQDAGCPEVTFFGGRAPQAYTNVYNVNLYDMATEKVDVNGTSHTSSKGSVNFSGYVGLGTWRDNYGSYYGHMWTRDVGRVMLELAHAGVSGRLRAAADYLHEYLDDSSERFPIPNWKRIANAREQEPGLRKTVEGKENDGHASTMLFVYQLWRTGVVDADWVRKNKSHIFDAPNFFFWQMDNPEKSNFDKVLYSESEASTQGRGGYDLFSNAIALFALRGYAEMCAACGLTELSGRCGKYAERLEAGIRERFVFVSRRYGSIFVDNNYDCWTYGYKRFAPLFLQSDYNAYDPAYTPDWMYETAKNTLQAQADEYLHPQAGRQMGYGQGYLCHAAAMLDDFQLFTDAVEAGSYFCYHEQDHNWLVPEGVILHPNRRCWYRNCDQTNAVQQAEMVKVGRMILGLDDLAPRTGLRLIPRLPDNFSGFSAAELSVCDFASEGAPVEKVPVHWVYERVPSGYRARLRAERPILLDRLRIGPFPASAAVQVTEGSGRELPFTQRILGDNRLFADLQLESRTECIDITARMV